MTVSYQIMEPSVNEPYQARRNRSRTSADTIRRLLTVSGSSGPRVLPVEIGPRRPPVAEVADVAVRLSGLNCIH